MIHREGESELQIFLSKFNTFADGTKGNLLREERNVSLFHCIKTKTLHHNQMSMRINGGNYESEFSPQIKFTKCKC